MKKSTKKSNLIARAIEKHQLGLLEEAKLLYQQILRDFPSNADALHLLGIIHLQSGNVQDAISLINRAIKLSPNVPEYYSNLGVAYKNLHDLYGAEKSYLKAIVLNPKYAEAYNNLGNIYKDRGQNALAKSNYQRAIDSNPNYAEPYNGIGLILFEIGESKYALEYFQKALELNPSSYEFWGNIAGPLIELKRTKEAIESLKKSLELNPSYLKSANNLAIAFKKDGQIEVARKALIELIGRAPHYHDAYITYANLLTDLGEIEASIAHCKKVLQFDPSNEEVRIQLALNYIYLNQNSLAEHILLEIGLTSPSEHYFKGVVWLSILKILSFDVVESKKYSSKADVVLDSLEKKYKASKAYKIWIDQLLTYWAKGYGFSDAGHSQILYSIGESHSLSAHGVSISQNSVEKLCKAEWVLGCKQWHLGSPLPNKFKRKFEIIMGSIPKESDVLLSIGEIDSRIDEGIQEVWAKDQSQSLDQLIVKTVQSYVVYVAKQANQYGHKVILNGIPAPNIDLTVFNAERSATHILTIAKMNACLQEEAKKYGFSFLDIYSLTNNGEGISNKKWHLDEYHLSSAAIQEAFLSYLI